MPRSSATRPYYPAFVDLVGRSCVVVGGGKIAARKVADLLKAEARVTVVAPEPVGAITKLAERGKLTLKPRKFRKADVARAFLVIAATDDHGVNRRVAEASPCLVNVVDTPEFCNFIVPSSVRQGPLTVAISTSGASPAMARAIRQEMEDSFGPAFGQYLGALARLRARAMSAMPDARERGRFLNSLGSRRVVRMLREGERPELPELPHGVTPKKP